MQVREGVLGANRAELSPEVKAAMQQRWTDYMLPRTGAGRERGREREALGAPNMHHRGFVSAF